MLNSGEAKAPDSFVISGDNIPLKATSHGNDGDGGGDDEDDDDGDDDGDDEYSNVDDFPQNESSD